MDWKQWIVCQISRTEYGWRCGKIYWKNGEKMAFDADYTLKKIDTDLGCYEEDLDE